eukprot:4290867-Pleurochrysis_carterae.AAC.2
MATRSWTREKRMPATCVLRSTFVRRPACLAHSGSDPQGRTDCTRARDATECIETAKQKGSAAEARLLFERVANKVAERLRELVGLVEARRIGARNRKHHLLAIVRCAAMAVGARERGAACAAERTRAAWAVRRTARCRDFRAMGKGARRIGAKRGVAREKRAAVE